MPNDCAYGTRVRLLACQLACIAAGLAGTATSARAAITVQIDNQTGRSDRNIYVMLDGGSSTDDQLRNQEPVRLSAIARRRFTLDSLPAGRIFFSFGSPVTSAEPPRSPVRYDKVELTYPGVANLTAVDFFGIPFRLQALNRSGRTVGQLGYSAPTATIERSLLAIPGGRRALVRTRSGAFVRFLSPQLSPSSFPSFAPYVHSMTGRQVTIRGAYFGTPFETFGYSGRFARDGSITLRGTITPKAGRPAPGNAVTVRGPSLPGAIYSVDGPYEWGGQTHLVSENDVYAAIYRDLISGFAWGYWGGRYGDDSARWSGKPPFAAARERRTKLRRVQ